MTDSATVTRADAGKAYKADFIGQPEPPARRPERFVRKPAADRVQA